MGPQSPTDRWKRRPCHVGTWAQHAACACTRHGTRQGSRGTLTPLLGPRPQAPGRPAAMLAPSPGKGTGRPPARPACAPVCGRPAPTGAGPRGLVRPRAEAPLSPPALTLLLLLVLQGPLPGQAGGQKGSVPASRLRRPLRRLRPRCTPCAGCVGRQERPSERPRRGACGLGAGGASLSLPDSLVYCVYQKIFELHEMSIGSC